MDIDLGTLDELIELERKNLSQHLSEPEAARLRELVGRLLDDFPDNRRRFLRVRSSNPTEIKAGDRTILGKALSIGGGGLFVSTDEAPALEIGSEITVSLAIEDTRTSELPIRGRVRRVKDGVNDPGIGIEFLELSEDHLDALIGHIGSCLSHQLVQTRETYRFFFENSADVAMGLDRAGRITQVNAPGAWLLGVSAQRLLGRPLSDLSITTPSEAYEQALARASLGHTVRLQMQLLTASGDLVAVDGCFKPMVIAELQVGFLFVGQDRQAQREIESSQRALERKLFQTDKLTTLGQLAAGLAHDIRNPLSFLLMSIESLEHYTDTIRHLLSRAREGQPAELDRSLIDEMTQSWPELLEDAHEGVRRVTGITDQLTAFSRVDDDEDDEIDVNEVITASLRMVKNLIRHQAQLQISLSPDLPATHSNFGRIAQVVINLLTNAAEAFHEPDLLNNRIGISSRHQSGSIIIEITDNGKGIEPGYVGLIFEPFYTSRKDSGGTGLGLAIVRDSAEALGGNIAVESEQEEGTRFTLTLPVRKSKAARPRGDPTPLPGRTTTTGRPRVLLVDDEPAVLRGFGRILSREFDVATTPSPNEALELIQKEAFDCLVCDVMIPEMSGMDLFEHVRDRNPGLAEHALFVTGGAFTSEQHDRLQRYGRPILHKPVQPTVLRDAVRALVAASRPTEV